MRWFVIGCGYVGRALARRLTATGAEVTVTRRTSAAAEAEAAATGARAAALDLDATVPASSLAPPGAVVVSLVPPGDVPGRRERALTAAIARPARLIYVSSTGVYAAGGGALVDEDWPLEPITDTGRARLAAERALTTTADAAGLDWTILRPAGIYGPDRGVAARIRAGSYRVIGHGHVSRIHVDDLVTAIIAAGTPEAPRRAIYNVADDDPAPSAVVADAVAAALGLPAPPRVPAQDVSADVAGMLTADRRIDNRRLKRELGVSLAFPSWRVELAGLTGAGT